jgi:predicted Ser/Thr protein kinase
MMLNIGARLGPYEIVSLLGAGGMGDVYRARDTRLDRDVALKVSRQQFNERFEREARAISALNHPNICALYDVGPDYLVMEYVDGEELRGPMVVDDALAIAMQIAEALRAAHEKGIVHRDLKPANIKLTTDGTVKVLDFGLAKAMDPVSGSGLHASAAQPTDSPTITSPAMTHAGMILGTAAYMAPEQARGKAVDSRVDIWAFGVVLYELITGERPFKGDDLTETLAAVVKVPPDLRPVPPRVRRLLEACLQKDPRRRLQSIGDVGLLLGADSSAAAGNALAAPRFARAVTVAASAIAIVASVGLAALALVHFRERPPETRALRLSIPIPDGAGIGFLELSPDGSRLLLMMTIQGTPQLYVRSLDGDKLEPLAGTRNARTPFWSADSRFIGFFADGKLKTIPAGGGPVRELCSEAGLGSGGAWNRDGVILWSGGPRYLRRVEANGGECRPLGTPDPDHAAAMPTFHPDGNHFFYVGGKSQDPTADGVYLATLDKPIGRRVLDDASSVIYTAPAVSGGLAHLLFLREGTSGAALRQ